MPKTLLLADDSVTIQKVVGISFANEDVEIVTVDNGDDAVARAREIRPDLVLADVVMPGLSGYEVCHAIKSDPNLRGIPVLLLTGTFETFDEAKAEEVGADGHITKPFEAQVLVDQVKSLLASSPGAAAPVTPAEPEPLGLTGRATPGGGPEPYDLFGNDTAPQGGATNAEPIESPPTTVMFGEEAQSETVLPTPLGDETLFEADPIAPANDALDEADLLAPSLEDTEAPDLLAGGADGLAGAETLITTDAEAPGSAEPIVLDGELSDDNAPTASTAPAGNPGSADLFGSPESVGVSDPIAVSEPVGASDPADMFQPVGTSDPVDVSGPGNPSDPSGLSATADLADPGEATTLLADPIPPPVELLGEEPAAPDAPTLFEFDEAASADLVSDASPSPATDPIGSSDPAPKTELFSYEPEAPAADLVADKDSSGAPVVSTNSEQAPSPGLLFDEDPMGQTTLDPEAGRSYDVSSSDLGASSSAAPSAPISLPSQPDWPADPERQDGAAEPDSEAVRHEETPPALSPMLERQVHDAVEKMAWDAFGDLAEQIVKDAVERIERVAWEVIPQMTETLIREEIRKLKGEE